MKKNDPIWMPMYWADYFKDTLHLSAAEHGGYLLLIGHYWVTQKPLPNDPTALRQIARMTPSEWRKSGGRIMSFFSNNLNEWRHSRIDDEITKSIEMMESSKARTKKATEARLARHEAARNEQRNVERDDIKNTGFDERNVDTRACDCDCPTEDKDIILVIDNTKTDNLTDPDWEVGNV